MEAPDDNIEPNDVEPELSFPRDDDLPITKTERIKLLLKSCWRGLVCFLTPIILVAVLVPFPPEKYQWCAYTLLMMAVYWVTECIPLPLTSLLPIVIFPFTGVMNSWTTCKCYFNDTILMFLGSMALAYAVEQSGLHHRISLGAIKAIGYSHYRLLFAMCFTTMFISMWITNTAATTMMVPINFALLQVFEDQKLLNIYDIDSDGEMVASSMTTCYFCASTFSATIGGIGTLVGTATNLVFKGLFQRSFPQAPEYLSFPKFSAFAIPYMIVMEICLYFTLLVMYIGFLRPNSTVAKSCKMSKEGMDAAKIIVNEKWEKLGKITFWEIMVIILFAGAMVMFFCRSPQIFYGWGDMISDIFELGNYMFVRDSAAAMLIVFLMMILPSTLDFFKKITSKGDDLPQESIPSVLDWYKMDEVFPYGFMFLLGGGFALSQAAKKEYSNLNEVIGNILRHLNTLPNYLILFLITTFTVFVTNFASNVSIANVLVPLTMQLAKEININPLWYNIVAGFSASYCFCLPVGTPGNLIVQGAARISTMQMIIAGVIPSVTTIIITWIACCFWAPVIWPDLLVQASNMTWIH